MADCFCFRNYQCLACEKKANGPVKKTRTSTSRSSANRVQAVCGTRAGYNRHIRLKKPTCDPCKAAQLAGVLAWKRKRDERKSA